MGKIVVLIVVVLMLYSFLNSITPDKYVVFVKLGNRFCTGIKVGKNRVLTARHLIFTEVRLMKMTFSVRAKGRILVNGDNATIAKDGGTKLDAVILEGNFNFKHYIKKRHWVKKMSIGQKVVIVGFPFGALFYDYARINRIEKGRAFVDKPFYPGMSGGLIMTEYNSFCGMVTQTLISGLGAGYGSFLYETKLYDFLY